MRALPQDDGEDAAATEKSVDLMRVSMDRPRLGRLQWLYTSTPVYFLTSCTVQRSGILANPEMHDTFAQQASTRGVFVGRYVIMPDHIHLFAAFAPQAPHVSEWMKALKRTLAKTLRDRGRRGACWQKGFFDHVMRSAESYSQKWLYVRENPVRAGLVSDPEDWPYQGEICHLTVEAL
jgi:putative transposase